MAKLLWKPSEKRVKGTNMYRFMNVINERYNQNCTEYAELYQWSIDNLPEFWAAMWNFADIIASKPYGQVIDDPTKMPGAKWFSEEGLISPKISSASGRSGSPDF